MIHPKIAGRQSGNLGIRSLEILNWALRVDGCGGLLLSEKHRGRSLKGNFRWKEGGSLES